MSWPRRFEVWLVSLDPTRGGEIRNTHPCVVVSPDELNSNIQTVIVAPMTTASRGYPTRVQVRFEGRKGEIVLDQIRTVDRTRLLRRLGAPKRHLPAGLRSPGRDVRLGLTLGRSPPRLSMRFRQINHDRRRAA